jgi:hypothetical protein
VPYTSMAQPGGIATAIDVLRAAGLVERLAALGVHDAGDIELDPPSGERGPSGLLNERALVRLLKTTSDAVEAWTIERLRSSVGGRRPAAQVGRALMLLDVEAAEDASWQSPGVNPVDLQVRGLGASCVCARWAPEMGSTLGSGISWSIRVPSHSRESKTVRSGRARRAGSRRRSMVVIRPLCSVRAPIA